MEAQVIHDAWFVLKYIIDDSGFDFEAYKITGKNDISGSGDASDLTTEDKPKIKGRVKWDGCIDFEYCEKMYEHYCGIHHAKQTYLLFKELYKLQEKTFES